MENLQVSKSTAKRLYPESPRWFQDVLTETFGAKCFRKRSYEEIKTFADACEECGTTEDEFNERFSNLGLDADTINYEKLKIVVRVINGGWAPDWSNTNQRKWWPWFNLSSGFGFYGSRFGYAGTNAGVGSRLCFESEEKSTYTAKQFIKLYEELLTIKK